MFFDIGAGILIAIFTSNYFGVHLGEALLMGGIVAALSPDFDFLVYFFKNGITREDYNHRNLVHYPLLFLPIITYVAYVLGGNVWATLFFLGALSHFIHDSIAIGWGIKWLYPFSNKKFVFLYHHSKIEKRGLRKLVFAFDNATLTKLVNEHGDDDWVKNIYYKWHPIAIVEFGVFLFSLISLYFYAN